MKTPQTTKKTKKTKRTVATVAGTADAVATPFGRAITACTSCGKHTWASKLSDGVCAACQAEIETDHQDGEHDEALVPECPMCQAEAKQVEAKRAKVAQVKQAKQAKQQAMAPAVAVEMPSLTRPCACGCGTQVRRTFAQGHDSRLRSQLKAMAMANETVGANESEE